MQHPVGYHLSNNRAEMVDFLALATNPTGLLLFGHQITSAYGLAAFFVLGISAWHIMRKNEIELFTKSFRMAAIFGLVSTLGVAVIGDVQGVDVAKNQPSKFAAMESLWETRTNAPMNLLQWPDVDNDRNFFEVVALPSLTSFLAFRNPNATVIGLKDIARELRPPVWPTFVSFRLMVGLGALMILALILAIRASGKKRDLGTYRWLLTFFIWAIPLPYVAIWLGWIVTELGRQPWIVWGVLKTADAISKNVSAGQVWFSLAGFVLVYGTLGAIDIWLLLKYARKGPDDDLSKIVKLQGRA